MTLQIILTVVLILLSAVFDSQRDKIQFDKARSWFPDWGWWKIRNYMEHTTLNHYLRKLFDTVLSFLNDGWHFCKSVSLLCWSVCLWLWTPDLTGFGAWNVLIILVLYSTIFEISYKNKI